MGEMRVTHEPCITIVSTHTIDRVAAPSGNGMVEVPGGPAWYIGQALERLDFRYQVITGQTVFAEVVPACDGEEYVIPELEPIPLPSRLEGDAVILSPVMHEIDALALPPAEGFMVADLQGFVREPNKRQSQTRGVFHLAKLIRRCEVIKGNVEEVALLDEETRRELEKTLLLVTHARKGAVVRKDGEEYVVKGRAVATSNTTGAGDTFLGAFVAYLLWGNEPAEAATKAVRFTETFLRERELGG